MSGTAVLHIIGGNDRGKQHSLDRPETRIGRGTDQDVVLADIAVSRRHVTIVMEGQRWRLKDLGSGNGSLVNGQRMDSVVLNDGDQIEIGNTLMRFDHPPSRPNAPPPAAPPAYSAGYPPPPYPPSNPGYPPPGYGGYPPPGYPPPAYGAPPAAGYAPPPGGYPSGGYPAGYHPPPAAPPGYPYPSGGFPQDGVRPPSAPIPIGAPAGQAPSYVGPPAASRDPAPRRGSVGRMIAFVAMGLVSAGGIAAIVSRTVFAKPLVVASDAEDFYRQGLRLFAAGDYELAKGKFNDAVLQAQDAPEPRRYARLCDTELTARNALRNAERALVSRRYAEAVRALDGVESTSIYYDQASRQRKDTAPKAAAELVDEARRLMQDNPDEARNRLKAALELDPSSSDARDQLGRVKGGTPGASTAPSAPAPQATLRSPLNTPPSAATVAAVSGSKKGRHGKEDEDELAAVKAAKTPSVAAPDSKAGMAAYKARDFAGAYRAFMSDSMRQSEKQATKTIEFANQVRALQQLVDRASADEPKNPSQAVKEYEQAIQLDQKLAKGVHAAYFKQRIGGLAVAAAKASFSSGNYEAAFQSAQAAQRGGGDASGVMKQLEQKAAELVSQGQAAQKSNVGQAKQLWRSVLKMVPTSSPNYTKAYALLNSATTQKRDEDED